MLDKSPDTETTAALQNINDQIVGLKLRVQESDKRLARIETRLYRLAQALGFEDSMHADR